MANVKGNPKKLKPIKVGPFVKQMRRDQERPQGMKEITIWIDDDSTGNKIQVENGNVQDLDHAYHLIRHAWMAMDQVNERPDHVERGENPDIT